MYFAILACECTQRILLSNASLLQGIQAIGQWLLTYPGIGKDDFT